ncbi:hypothetical protein SDC9_83951 [bioreactor metagenome]|uniref:Uncharacterized protein n=1 Tax=bioreactor metagenome TaxID=1076179 RepID=A0A644ZBS7_9ZZZZ|nr:hypothetical protein [Oscillospiraceae bacterium]
MINIEQDLYDFYHKYENKCLKHYKKVIKNFKISEPEDYEEYEKEFGNFDNIELRIYGINYELRLPELPEPSEPLINIIYDLFINDHNIGYFKICFTNNEKIADEFLCFN